MAVTTGVAGIAPQMIDPRPAGLLRRLGAICYDTLIIGALLIAATAVLLVLTRGESISAGTLWYQFILGDIVLIYFSVSWWRSGQTIGMVAWRLRLRTNDGVKASLPQCLARAFAATLSWLVAGLGFVWVLIDHRNRGWHDLLSGTELIYEKPLSALAPGQQQ